MARRPTPPDQRPPGGAAPPTPPTLLHPAFDPVPSPRGTGSNRVLHRVAWGAVRPCPGSRRSRWCRVASPAVLADRARDPLTVRGLRPTQAMPLGAYRVRSVGPPWSPAVSSPGRHPSLSRGRTDAWPTPADPPPILRRWCSRPYTDGRGRAWSGPGSRFLAPRAPDRGGSPDSLLPVHHSREEARAQPLCFLRCQPGSTKGGGRRRVGLRAQPMPQRHGATDEPHLDGPVMPTWHGSTRSTVRSCRSGMTEGVSPVGA
jgi:hypothetical protein